ncbi:MAG: TonB-dependent receptor [Acidobacteria bacterium]|nr:TonB-dependent receptor [Acidobacteriota bacterium]
MRNRTSFHACIDKCATRALRRVVTGLLFCAVLAATLPAQERTGRIYGRVLDASGAAVPGATIVLTNTATGIKRTVLSSEIGLYNAPKLDTGPYQIEAEMSGFKKYIRSGISLLPGEVLEIDLPLEVGQISEMVTVTGQAPLVNTTTGGMSMSLETSLLDTIPLSARDAKGLLRLVPGAVSDYRGDYAIQGIEGGKAGYSIDGLDAQDPWDTNLSNAPPPDVLKELTVQTNFSAEHGRAGGAMVLMTTKSGTNRFHGSVYDYFRCENLNANSFDNNRRGLKKADFKRHQLGFTAGGPVFIPSLYNGRNRSFFFIGYQDLKLPSAPYTGARGGLTAAELEGDFSNSPLKPAVRASAANTPGSPFAGMTGQTITNLKPFLSPAAVRIYKGLNMPIVQNSGDRFYENRITTESHPEWTLRADHSIRDAHMLTFSMYLREDKPEPRQSDYAPEAFKNAGNSRTQHYGLSHIWTMSSNTVNELRVGYQRVFEFQRAEWEGVNWSLFGIPYPQPHPKAALNFTGTGSTSTFSPNFFNLRSSATLRDEARDIYDLREIFSWTKGSHYLKTGLTLQRHHYYRTTIYIPSYAVNGQWLGNQAAEFLIGWPRNGTLGEPAYQPHRRHIFHLFVQDDWKMSPRLSLNLGLRWEPQYWGYRIDNRALLFKPFTKSTQYPNFPSGILTYGDSDWIGRSGRKNDLNNLAPRLGAAYRLDQTGKMVLRAAWGLFYDVESMSQEIYLAGGATTFPFFHSYSTNFNLKYPAGEGWLDVPVYSGQAKPDISKPLDPSKAVFNPNARYGFYYPKQTQGHIHQWNISFEHEFRPGWMYSAGYQGHKAAGLPLYDFWNVPAQRDANDSWDNENMASRRPIQEYRLLTYNYLSDLGRSVYHAVQSQVQARVSHFRMNAWYTGAYARSNNPGTLWEYWRRDSPYPLDDKDWGPPAQTRAHNFMVVPTWELPFFRESQNLLGRMLGGWEATAVFNVQSGPPVNLEAENNAYQWVSCSIRPNLTGQPLTLKNWRKDPNLVYVNKEGFSQPAPRTYGDAPINPLNWPYTKSVDMTVMKTFRIHGESVKMDLRFDFFNLFNWVHFDIPGDGGEGVVLIYSPTDFSMIDRAKGPRSIQVGARIAW